MASVADSTVFTVKQEGVRSVPLPTLRGIQDAVSLSFDHLEEMCAHSLTKVILAKVSIREFLLCALKPHTLRDPLLASDLIHPTVFAPTALDAAISSLRRLWMPIHSVTMRFASLLVPPRGSSHPPSASMPASQPRVDDRSAVLLDLQRQVADLKSRLHTPGRDVPPPAVDRRGRGFFWGTSGNSCGHSSSQRQQSRGSTSGAPTSSRGPRGRRCY